MTTLYVGTLDVATINIGVTLAVPMLQARLGELNGAYAELQAKLASIQAQLNLVAEVSIPNPLTLTAGLQAALAGVAQIALQFPLATVSLGASLEADIAATMALAADIQLKIDLLLALIAELTLAMSGAGIAVYAYDGRADRLGPEVDAQLSGGLPGTGLPAQPIKGLVLACSDLGAWDKLSKVLKVT